MKFFTEKALDSDGDQFQLVREAYWKYFEGVRNKIPIRLFELHRFYSLHDSKVVSVSKILQGRDLVMVVDGFINGFSCGSDRSLFVLHFIKWRECDLMDLLGKEIDVIEIDFPGEARTFIRILYRGEAEYSEVEFSFLDFDFYVRNYREAMV